MFESESFEKFQRGVSSLRLTIDSWGETMDWMERALGTVPAEIIKIPKNLQIKYSPESCLTEEDQVTISHLKFTLQTALYQAEMEGWDIEKLSKYINQILSLEEFRGVIGE